MVNFFEDAAGNRYTRSLSATFTNTYIGGNLASEVAMGIDNNEVFDVRFENSALKIEPNPEAGHYTLTDTTMFKDCEFNLNWGFSSTPWIPKTSGGSYQILFPYYSAKRRQLPLVRCSILEVLAEVPLPLLALWNALKGF